MDFPHETDNDQECLNGNGDINDYNVERCRVDYPGEDLCIFPFYWAGKLKTQCSFLEEEQFLIPVFQCPIRNITRKLKGINDFIYSDYTKQVEIKKNFEEFS